MQHFIPKTGILTGLMNKLGLPHDPWRFKAEITEYDKVIYGNQYGWARPFCAAFAFSQDIRASAVDCIPAPNESIFIAISAVE